MWWGLRPCSVRVEHLPMDVKWKCSPLFCAYFPGPEPGTRVISGGGGTDSNKFGNDWVGNRGIFAFLM